ncbi:pituitary tumor-transforming gene 1 protein-interacting protein, partial [Plakobranchus ocellatus]
CNALNASCSDCLGNSKCMYCYTDNTCKLYPSGKIIPPSSYCALDKARWGTCLVNFEALLISMGVIGGVLLLTITGCCIYCCYCRKGKNKRYEREDAKFESQRMERKARQEERRNERRSRLDEIRMKYGLMKEDSAPYTRFDA